MLLLFSSLALAITNERARPIPVAEGEQSASITAARLILRDDSSMGKIYTLDESWRLGAIETLREHGYDAKGGENLVFGDDRSLDADYALGGEISEGECWGNGYGVDTCWLQVDWQVLDTRTKQVVYEQSVQGTWRSNDAKTVLDQALTGALEGLLTYPSFHDFMIQDHQAAEWVAPPALEIKECGSAGHRLPKGLEDAMEPVVMLKSKGSVGTGVLVSSDGWVLTAAHVVEGQSRIGVKTMGGASFDAEVVRVDPVQDIALVKLPGSGYACTPMREGDASIGEDLWVVGNPLGEDLSFSAAKGMVSARRSMAGGEYIQTDAPINPGYSGGPMLDDRGRLLGIVSWKISGDGVEGLSFGIPVEAAQERLSIVNASASATEWEPLKIAEIEVAGGDPVRRFTPDESSSLVANTATSSSTMSGHSSWSDRTRADIHLPARVTVMGAGLAAVAATGIWYYTADTANVPVWRTAQVINGLGWTTASIASLTVVSGLALDPPPPPEDESGDESGDESAAESDRVEEQAEESSEPATSTPGEAPAETPAEDTGESEGGAE